MIKLIQLKRLQLRAKKILKDNNDAFALYETDITITTDVKHHCLRDVAGADYIVPYTHNGIGKFVKNGQGNTYVTLESMTELFLCMNSIHDMAIIMNKVPQDFLDETLEKLFKNLRSGIYPMDRDLTLGVRQTTDRNVLIY